MFPAVVRKSSYGRRNRGGCGVGCFMTLIILLLILGAGWFFVVRPYVHNIAQAQIDQALTSAVNQIPAKPAQLPANPVPISENAINNLIVLNLAPSNPVKNPQTTITPNNIRLTFQTYGQTSAITIVPTVNNGQIIVTRVNVEGIASLIMSPDEMATLLNKHLADAQGRLGRTVKSVQLKDQEVDLTFG